MQRTSSSSSRRSQTCCTPEAGPSLCRALRVQPSPCTALVNCTKHASPERRRGCYTCAASHGQGNDCRALASEYTSAEDKGAGSQSGVTERGMQAWCGWVWDGRLSKYRHRFRVRDGLEQGWGEGTGRAGNTREVVHKRGGAGVGLGTANAHSRRTCIQASPSWLAGRSQSMSRESSITAPTRKSSRLWESVGFTAPRWRSASPSCRWSPCAWPCPCCCSAASVLVAACTIAWTCTPARCQKGHTAWQSAGCPSVCVRKRQAAQASTGKRCLTSASTLGDGWVAKLSFTMVSLKDRAAAGMAREVQQGWFESTGRARDAAAAEQCTGQTPAPAPSRDASPQRAATCLRCSAPPGTRGGTGSPARQQPRAVGTRVGGQQCTHHGMHPGVGMQGSRQRAAMLPAWWRRLALMLGRLSGLGTRMRLMRSFTSLLQAGAGSRDATAQAGGAGPGPAGTRCLSRRVVQAPRALLRSLHGMVLQAAGARALCGPGPPPQRLVRWEGVVCLQDALQHRIQLLVGLEVLVTRAPAAGVRHGTEHLSSAQRHRAAHGCRPH